MGRRVVRSFLRTTGVASSTGGAGSTSGWSLLATRVTHRRTGPHRRGLVAHLKPTRLHESLHHGARAGLGPSEARRHLPPGGSLPLLAPAALHERHDSIAEVALGHEGHSLTPDFPLPLQPVLVSRRRFDLACNRISVGVCPRRTSRAKACTSTTSGFPVVRTCEAT